ncbi:MAG: hypothetical protein LBQ35_05795 [Spirochaetaceae bacterium]|jgi:hypothetical protein|nr:hypothetical protein [Spirochaetaceae bacterium]
MKTTVILSLAVLMAACGRGPGVARNQAGTQSVAISGALLEAWLNAPAEPAPPLENLPPDWGSGGTFLGGGPDAPFGAAPDAALGAGSGTPLHGDLAEVRAAASGPVVEIKEKMFIAQTNDVYLNAESYLGKTIKLEGLYKTEQPYYEDGEPYCFVLRYGPGCCGTDGNAGFEVAWDQRPEAAPEPGEDDWVQATGVLKIYEEDGYPYLYLSLLDLRVLDRRGAEFVNQ